MDTKKIVAVGAAVVAAVALGAFLGSRAGGDGDVATGPSTSSTAVDETVPETPDSTTSTVADTSTTSPMPVPGEAPPGRGITVDAWVLGWWDGDTWRDGIVASGQEPTVPIDFDDEYDFIDIDGNTSTALITRLDAGCYFDENHLAIGDVGYDRVGVPAGFDTQPRSVTPIAAADAHRADVRDWLTSEGIGDAEVSIDRVLRVDLDGDGDNEVLIEASSIENGTALLGEPEGSYSVLLLRAVDDADDVVTTVIDGFAVDEENANSESFPGFIEVYRFIAVADVNGDGVFEIATGSRYYEGSGAALLGLDGTATRELLSAGCGV